MADNRPEGDDASRLSQRERLAIVAGVLLLIFLATLVINPDFVTEVLSGVRDRIARD